MAEIQDKLECRLRRITGVVTNDPLPEHFQQHPNEWDELRHEYARVRIWCKPVKLPLGVEELEQIANILKQAGEAALAQTCLRSAALLAEKEFWTAQDLLKEVAPITTPPAYANPLRDAEERALGMLCYHLGGESERLLNQAQTGTPSALPSA